MKQCLGGVAKTSLPADFFKKTNLLKLRQWFISSCQKEGQCWLLNGQHIISSLYLAFWFIIAVINTKNSLQESAQTNSPGSRDLSIVTRRSRVKMPPMKFERTRKAINQNCPLDYRPSASYKTFHYNSVNTSTWHKVHDKCRKTNSNNNNNNNDNNNNRRDQITQPPF